MKDDAQGSDLASLGHRAEAAQRALGLGAGDGKSEALRAAAAHLRRNFAPILAANAEDVNGVRAAGRPASRIDRLVLDPGRLEAVARGLEDIAALPDPVGETIAEWRRPNGLSIRRVRVPIGVIGIIFESRPNVAAEAGALAMKAGNAAILRGGSDSWRTSMLITAQLRSGLADVGLGQDLVQMMPTTARSAVGEMLSGLGGTLDLIVPRGGRSLVERVQREARVPVLAHLEGLCHVYVHAAADPAKARAICLNSKMRRTGVCGAAETILIDEAVAPALGRDIVATLIAAGCEVRGDDAIRACDPRVVSAREADWSTEYLDAIVSMRVVAGLDAAVAHIRRYGSEHTDSIVTEDTGAAERFLAEVDSAIVLHNASTQFADGGEFGFGGEIGIATGRLHARGPVGLEQLTTFKYQVRGDGQIRP
jgi:glutamate-5-semialdehyde dehydrogenase